MGKKISAIVPVYNTPDDFLYQCVHSLLNQTYQNVEIILVDDGSQSKTADICDKMATEDPRIIVLHQKNQGPSVARNTALQYATGEYITFVDSDDVLSSKAWTTCIDKMEQYDVDCLVFGWIDNSQKFPNPIAVSYEKDQLLPAKQAVEMIASNNEACGGGYPWNKIWRRESILQAHENKMPLFDTNLFAYEDKEWIIRALDGLKNVLLTTDIFYNYRYVEASLTNSDEKWAVRQYNAYYAYDKILELLKETNYEAYCGAVNFYFYFGFVDLYNQLRHPSHFGGVRRIRKTKKHMYRLCKKIRCSELNGYKRKCLWLIMQIWGIF